MQLTTKNFMIICASFGIGLYIPHIFGLPRHVPIQIEGHSY